MEQPDDRNAFPALSALIKGISPQHAIQPIQNFPDNGDFGLFNRGIAQNYIVVCMAFRAICIMAAESKNISAETMRDIALKMAAASIADGVSPQKAVEFIQKTQ